MRHIPLPDADWKDISDFAHTFDGYEFWGSFERCAEIAHQPRLTTLAELRTFLFFSFRAIRHGGYEPGEEELTPVRAAVKEIRRLVIGRAPIPNSDRHPNPGPL